MLCPAAGGAEIAAAAGEAAGAMSAAASRREDRGRCMRARFVPVSPWQHRSSLQRHPLHPNVRVLAARPLNLAVVLERRYSPAISASLVTVFQLRNVAPGATRLTSFIARLLRTPSGHQTWISRLPASIRSLPRSSWAIASSAAGSGSAARNTTKRQDGLVATSPSGAAVTT